MIAEVSIVIPIYNEALILDELISRLITTVSPLTKKYELILVNDCSTDDTKEVLENLKLTCDKLKVISLKKNMGQFLATVAGLHQELYKHIIIMDGDLQDNPEDIKSLIKEYNNRDQANLTIFASKENRKESHFIQLATLIYNGLIKLRDKNWPSNIGSFLLTSRSTIDDALKSFDNINVTNANISVLINHFSEEVKTIPIEKRARYDKVSRIGNLGLFKEAIGSLILLCKLRISKRGNIERNIK